MVDTDVAKWRNSSNVLVSVSWGSGLDNGGGWDILDSTEVAGPDDGNISEGVGVGNYLVSLISLKTVNGGVWVPRERVGGGDWADDILVDNLWADHGMSKAFLGGVGEATSQTVRFNDGRVSRWNAHKSGGTGNSQDGSENSNLIHIEKIVHEIS